MGKVTKKIFNIMDLTLFPCTWSKLDHLSGILNISEQFNFIEIRVEMTVVTRYFN
jgi:hypothetical protein